MLKVIKSKIKSVKNLKKITRALEVVSTVKLQRVKQQSDNLREYLKDLLFILATVWSYINIFEDVKTIKNSNRQLCILITSERWLCWALNSKLLKKFYEEYKDKKDRVDVFAIWKKWMEYLVRTWFNVVWQLNLKDTFEEKEVLPLYSFLEANLKQWKYWKIKIYFNYFKNTLVQIPVDLILYPLKKENFDEFVKQVGFEYKIISKVRWKDLLVEPDLESLKREINRQIRNYIIASAIIQNKAWEHASRMIAMKNATDNSENLIKSLTLSFNKARQSAITQEISEIVSAKIAIEANW